MLNLPEVTLCTLGSAKYSSENQKALNYSAQGVEFGDVKLIEHECPTIDDWNKAIFYDLGDYIDTPYALLVHPDGFVVHPEAWHPVFLEYDYIGSPWPMPTDDFSYRDKYNKIQRVGNSVSLRSKKLMELPKQLDLKWMPFHGFTNEDGAICVNYRHHFEHNMCKFAPIEVAKYFGRENDLVENMDVDKTFVFHRHNGRNSIYPNFED